jgi:hypothetical protein
VEREWWRRVPLVLWRPREVFAALRDLPEDSAQALQEPMTAVVFLAGISMFLSTSTAGRLYDNVDIDGLVIFVEALVSGALVGLQNYWLGGAALLIGLRGAGSAARYRTARQIVGLATTPFVLSLIVLWPVRLAVFGGDLFRTGGSDEGASGAVLAGIDIAFVVWAFVIALIGVRTLEGWSWARSVAGTAVATVLFALLVLAAVFA